MRITSIEIRRDDSHYRVDYFLQDARLSRIELKVPPPIRRGQASGESAVKIETLMFSTLLPTFGEVRPVIPMELRRELINGHAGRDLLHIKAF
jgi:hypothetical protein